MQTTLYYDRTCRQHVALVAFTTIPAFTARKTTCEGQSCLTTGHLTYCTRVPRYSRNRTNPRRGFRGGTGGMYPQPNVRGPSWLGSPAPLGLKCLNLCRTSGNKPTAPCRLWRVFPWSSKLREALSLFVKTASDVRQTSSIKQGGPGLERGPWY